MGKPLSLPQIPNMGETMQKACITFAYKDLKTNSLSTLDVTDVAKLWEFEVRGKRLEGRSERLEGRSEKEEVRGKK